MLSSAVSSMYRGISLLYKLSSVTQNTVNVFADDTKFIPQLKSLMIAEKLEKTFMKSEIGVRDGTLRSIGKNVN